MNYRYTVKARFQSSEVAQEWLQWLQAGHCEEVLRRGATKVEIIALDNEPTTYEVRYVFDNHDTFNSYETEHAETLRAEGLALFPVERGIVYTRSTGTVIYSA